MASNSVGPHAGESRMLCTYAAESGPPVMAAAVAWWAAPTALASASFFDTSKLEAWGACAAGLLLVAVVSGARHAVRPVKHPAFFVILRMLAAMALVLPYFGVMHGDWTLSAGTVAAPVDCAEVRVTVVHYIVLCGAFVMASAFWRLATIAAALSAALGAVECAHVTSTLAAPGTGAWGQRLGAYGFLVAAAICIAVLVVRMRRARGESTRTLWERRIEPRSIPLAVLLSFVPGLGFYYATPGRKNMGWLSVFLCATGAAYVVFVGLWQQVWYYGSPSARAGPQLFLLSYCLLLSVGMALAIVAMTRSRPLS